MRRGSGAPSGGGRGVPGVGGGELSEPQTLCEFRRRYLADFQRLVVRLAAETGLATFGTLSIDGTKVRANASKRRAMSSGDRQHQGRRRSSAVDGSIRRHPHGRGTHAALPP